MQWRERYLEFIKCHTGDIGSLRIGVDCSNGMASLLAHDLFPNAIIINDTLDGTFPNHSPNPLKAEAREQISALVKSRGLECGVIFDGDADRAMFVDEHGEFVQPDYLIPIIAQLMGDKGTVLHDVRTSRGAIERLKELGFSPVMVPVGHAFAKPKMRELQALCGGELAGHYYFGDFFGCDSGVLAALRVLEALVRFGGKFSEMMAPIVTRYANSGEINFKVEDKEGAIARVMKVMPTLGTELSRSEIDGVRIEFFEGWVNIRKSNTEPYLRLIIETQTAALLEDWLGRIKVAIG